MITSFCVTDYFGYYGGCIEELFFPQYQLPYFYPKITSFEILNPSRGIYKNFHTLLWSLSSFENGFIPLNIPNPSILCFFTSISIISPSLMDLSFINSFGMVTTKDPPIALVFVNTPILFK